MDFIKNSYAKQKDNIKKKGVEYRNSTVIKGRT